MKVLFVCNTPSQIIYAVNIILNDLDADATVDVIVTDNFRSGEAVAERLRATGAVNRVFYAQVHERCARGMKNVFSFLTERSRRGMFGILGELPAYDSLFINNIDIFTTVLYDHLMRQNREMSVNRFEEGYSSYFSTLRQNKQCRVLEKILKIEGNPILSEKIGTFWYFEPDFRQYDTKDRQVRKITPIDRHNPRLAEVLNSTFAIGGTSATFPQKYVFFEESFTINGIDINDLEVAERFVSLVGRENVLVRMHPRMVNNRFRASGYHVSEPDGTPWEMVQFNNDYSDKVFVTISSGSVLGSKMYFADNIKTLFLYKLTDKDVVGKEYETHLEHITEKYGKTQYFIPETWEELEEILRK